MVKPSINGFMKCYSKILNQSSSWPNFNFFFNLSFKTQVAAYNQCLRQIVVKKLTEALRES